MITCPGVTLPVQGVAPALMDTSSSWGGVDPRLAVELQSLCCGEQISLHHTRGPQLGISARESQLWLLKHKYWFIIIKCVQFLCYFVFFYKVLIQLSVLSTEWLPHFTSVFAQWSRPVGDWGISKISHRQAIWWHIIRRHQTGMK